MIQKVTTNLDTAVSSASLEFTDEALELEIATGLGTDLCDFPVEAVMVRQ